MKRTKLWGVLGAICAIGITAVFSGCDSTPNITNINRDSIVIVNGGGNTPSGTPSLTFSPPGGDLTVNVPVTLSVTCKDAAGNVVACSNPTASSSNPAAVSVSSLTLTCLAAGQSATITVQAKVGSTTVVSMGTFACVAANSTPSVTGVTISPSGTTITLTGSGGVCAAAQPIHFSAFVGSSSSSTGVSQAVTWTATGGSIDQSGNWTPPTTAGAYQITATSQQDPTKSQTITETVVTNCGSSNGTNSASPSSISVMNCTGFVSQYTLHFYVNGVEQSGATWSWSSGSNLGSINGSTLTLSSTSTGTGNIVGTYNGQTVNIPVTITQCASNGSITVVPNPLNINLGDIGSVTATPHNVSGTPSWSSTTGCAIFGSPNSLTTTVQGARVCRDSLVVTINGVKGYTILNVMSASTGCTIGGPQSLAVNATAQLNASCGTNQPWWFSHDPSIVSVVGAPYVCVYGGTSWPCGPTATIKGTAIGSTSVCVQPGVTDTTHVACQTETVTASSSGDMIPNDNGGIELKLPDHAPTPYARAHATVYTWGQYVQLRKTGVIKPQ